MKTNKSATNIRQCSGCRQRKDIVLNTKGMGYCEDCKHKAPTGNKFREFIFDKTKISSFQVDQNRRIKGTIRG